MYYNPVKVVETENWIEEYSKFKEKTGISNSLIITSKGNFKRQELSTVFNSNSILNTVEPNPTFDSCQIAIDFVEKSKFDCVTAIGGGSVMDTAKVVMASLGTQIYDVADLLNITHPYNNKVLSIFIPTTHGTGSEVTKWGTVWNTVEKKKYSISHQDLYPSIAILDANLMSSLPLDISIITTMDALSHSFESIWNNNANQTSTNYAVESICMILRNIDSLKQNPSKLETRKILLKASNLAGLAFSNTKTAAAHSISYPLTINYGIPHGIASSLALLPLLRINMTAIEDELDLIIKELELKDIYDLENLIKIIPDTLQKYNLESWGVNKDHLDELVEQSFTKGRMDNNIVNLSERDIYNILQSIY